jgi:hypothetical protein
MRRLVDLIPEEARSDGLSSAELAHSQEAAGVVFPPDLCELLSDTVPVGRQWPDWRERPSQVMRAWNEQLLDGIVFDVQENDFWLDDWGDRPTDIADAREVLSSVLVRAPRLIPVYGHRAIPNDPMESGNPVLSVVQTDVIIYGANLREYLINEFHARPPGGAVVHSSDVRSIRFWDDLARG